MELKKLIVKLLIALLLIMAGAALIRHWFDPSPWYGNEILDEKMKFWDQNHHQFNTIFIGSSIVLRNFDPIFFDQLAPSEEEISTYNFGMGGTLPPESYKMFEWLLQNRSNNLKNVFFELRDLGLFHPHHLHTLKRRYWITPKEYTFILRSSLQSTIPWKLKKRNIAFHGISLFERMFVINYFNDRQGFSEIDPETMEFRRSLIRGTAGHGYLPVNESSARPELFVMNMTQLGIMANTYRSLREDAQKPPYNQPHLNRIQSMIEECEQLGIRIWFVLHPKHNIRQLEETLRLFYHIPENNRINLADPDDHPKLYSAFNSFSENHFNLKGTRMLTQLMSEAVFASKALQADETLLAGTYQSE